MKKVCVCVAWVLCVLAVFGCGYALGAADAESERAVRSLDARLLMAEKDLQAIREELAAYEATAGDVLDGEVLP